MKIGSFFVLLLCFALYDTLLEGQDGYSVNLDVFYFVSLFSFILFWMIHTLLRSREPLLIAILALPIALRIVLNLLSINRDYDYFQMMVSNKIIDHVTWTSIALFVGLRLWVRYRMLRG